MDISLKPEIAEDYKSLSQKARVITEKWFEDNMYCPACSTEFFRTYPT